MGDAEGHVGVAGEVAVDLEGVGEQGDPGGPGLVAVGVGEDRVGEQGHAVGDDPLLEQAHEEELHAEVARAQFQRLRPADLRQEVAGADDRPGDEVREEQDEQQEVRQAALRLAAGRGRRRRCS